MLAVVGFLRDQQTEQQKMGFSACLGCSDCDACPADYAIRQFMEGEALSCDYSFCGRSETAPIAADTHDVLVFMSQGLRTGR
jgi:hypothetical protein